MLRSKATYLFFLGMVILCFSCQKVESDSSHWYKGNLHTHSYWSDGDDYPEMIMDWYKTHGYQFIALSEHNTIADHEKWVRIGQDSLKKVALNNYRGRFGDDWVVDQLDENGLAIKLKTLEEYRPIFEEPGKFLIIQSEEITNQIGDKPLHLNATNLRNLIEPQEGESVVEILQKSIDAVQQQREETDQPMIIHLNHPNFHYAVSLEDMIALKGEQFFEVFNGHHMVHNQGDSTHMGTEEMWDLVNIAYLKQGKPLLYALGTDDSHNYHRMGRQWSNSGRGWVMVHASELTAESIIAALEAGDFYASTGVTFSRLEVQDGTLSVSVKAEPGVHYQIQFIGCRQGADHSEVFSEVEGTSGSFTLQPDQLFVRAKVLSDKQHPNPIENLDYEMAWSQPVTHTN
ncbi:MAG: hypothetical protein KDC28_01270 [Saprospiraceae bacterium]|nr:hypothetical protein [Saprospiraceae bacterium]